MARAVPTITAAEAKALAGMPKAAAGPLVWQRRGNHAGHMMAASVVLDSQGITLPGQVIAIEVRAPVLVDSCLYLFTLFKTAHGQRRRVYQLEVVPEGKRSHNGPEGALYGPHEHWGDELVLPVHDPAVHCGDFAGALAHFTDRCTLVPVRVDPPC